jgi:Ni/Fe-hydrogenase subunit HybB-like protein
MTIFESWHSSRAFGRHLELPLLASMGRVLAVLLTFYLTTRFLDLLRRDALPLLRENRTETWLFGLEILLMLVPAVLLFRRGIRLSPGALYACAVMVVLGFVTHRLNVSVTGIEAASGAHYVPRWTEVVLTLWFVSLGFAIFRLVAKFLPIFETEPAPPMGSLAPPLPARVE